jgi:hypothetical protein
MDWFNLTNAIFDNSNNHQRNEHLIRGFTPVNSLIKETSRCFNNLKGLDDDSANKLKWLIWNIRQSIVLGILPFDADSLCLRERLASLKIKSKYFPNISESISKIGQIIEYLLENPDNPKAIKVFDLIREAELSQIKYGLVSFLGKSAIAGWADELKDKIKMQGRNCIMVSSRQVLNIKNFDQIILPSGGKSSPLLYDLTYGRRAKTIDVVAYDSEPIMHPAQKLLPEGLYRCTEPLDDRVLSDGIVHSVEGECLIEGWEESGFWESIRPSFGVKEGVALDRQHIIRARLVLLPESKMVYLQDDRKIIELSDLIEHRTELEEINKKFHRKSVSKLKTGDMILLRTSGSGNGLEETADEIMRADGKENLKSKALDWKKHLKEALESMGPQEIYERLKLKGYGLSSPPSYLWHWTTDEVISPESDSRFFELLAILDDLGFLKNETDLIELAQSKWELMRELKQYHHRAGHQNRRDLLSILREKISTDTDIEDILDLRLPGESSVMLALFRVFGVDPNTVNVPYKDIGVIKSLEI